MKEKFYKMILFLIYLILLAVMLDFDITLVINPRMLIIVVIGSGLLTLIKTFYHCFMPCYLF